MEIIFAVSEVVTIVNFDHIIEESVRNTRKVAIRKLITNFHFKVMFDATYE